jgi:AraC family transcriptional regulator, ethanolamine operon transcriptional activator
VASASAAFQTGSAGRVTLDSFDAVRSLSPGWEQSYAQLGRGTQACRLTFARARSMELSVVSRDPGVLFQGAPPRGMAVVAVRLRGDGMHLQRRAWERNLLGVAPRGCEFEIISTTPHTLFGLGVDHERLDEASLAHWGQRFPANGAGPILRVREAASLQHLVATWAGWLARSRRDPGILADPDVAALMEEEVIGAVIDYAAPVFGAPPVRRRRDIALRAEGFLRRSLEEPIRIADVCKAARTSRPSLHASFHSAFGMSPMAYWRSLRLAAARKDLEQARRGVTVAEVAVKWGFYRLGHFAADYRAMFGEKPSETLAGRRGRTLTCAR